MDTDDTASGGDLERQPPPLEALRERFRPEDGFTVEHAEWVEFVDGEARRIPIAVVRGNDRDHHVLPDRAGTVPEVSKRVARQRARLAVVAAHFLRAMPVVARSDSAGAHDSIGSPGPVALRPRRERGLTPRPPATPRPRVFYCGFAYAGEGPKSTTSHASSPTIQASCPGSIRTTSPGRASPSVPSSMTTFIRPESM